MPTLSREELHTLVWADPLPAAAARLGVRAAWLRAACDDAGVPRPGPGHWTRLRAGKPAVPLALPPRHPGARYRVIVPEGHQDRDAELAEPLPDPPVFDEATDALRARLTAELGPVTATDRLERSGPPVRRLLNDDARRTTPPGRRKAQLEAPLFTSATERRRLQILDGLSVALARHGAALQIGDKAARELAVRVGVRIVAFTLETQGAAPTTGPESPMDAPIPLALRLSEPAGAETGPGLWIDTPHDTLEFQLAEIAVAILVTGEAAYRAAEAAAHAWRVTRRAEDAAELARRRADAERRRGEREIMKARARRDRLLSQAQDWRAARDIRSFVREVLAEAGDPKAGSALAEWQAWALAEADTLDPALHETLEPWRREDEAGIERPCGCGFRCERSCGCGLSRACECECDGKEDAEWS